MRRRFNGGMPGRVIAGQRSNTQSLHYPEREVCAARSPDSRIAFPSNSKDTPSPPTKYLWRLRVWSGRTLYALLPTTHNLGTQCPHLLAPKFGLQAITTPPSCQYFSSACKLYFLLRNPTNHMGVLSRDPLLSSQIASKIWILEAGSNRINAFPLVRLS